MALSGNKGEWSEVYALFKILSDGKLYPGNANLNKIPGFFYPVISILREELAVKKTFEVSSGNIIIADQSKSITIPVSLFVQQAQTLLAHIKTSNGPSFTIASTEAFLKQLGCFTLKADSTTKADIIINIHDSRTNLQPVLGFSIKSKLGSASTLLNASTATNFTYKIKGASFTSNEIIQINSINTQSKIRDRIRAIYAKGAFIELVNFDNSTFENNLILIDSLLPQILSNALSPFSKMAS